MTTVSAPTTGETGPGTRPGVAVRLEGLTRRYGSVVALDGLDLDIERRRDGSLLLVQAFTPRKAPPNEKPATAAAAAPNPAGAGDPPATPQDRARRLLDLASHGRVVWIGSPDGDPGLAEAVAEVLADNGIVENFGITTRQFPTLEKRRPVDIRNQSFQRHAAQHLQADAFRQRDFFRFPFD